MAAHQSVSPEQFEDLIFPGVNTGGGGWSTKRTTYRGNVPVQSDPEKRRLWRSTDIGNPHGMWADKPLPGYGGRMMYMDVHHDVAEANRAGESGQKHYAWYDKRQSMPGKVHTVEFHGGKEYEMSDYREYNERWG